MHRIYFAISSIGIVILAVLFLPCVMGSKNQKQETDIAHKQTKAAWKNVEKYIEHRKNEEEDSFIGLFPLFLLMRKNEVTYTQCSALVTVAAASLAYVIAHGVFLRPLHK